MTTTQPANPAADTLPASPPARPPGAASEIERTAGMLLANRYIWLIVSLALYLIGQLSYTQWKFERFDTLLLVSHLTFIVELALLACALVMAGSTAAVARRWLARYGARLSLARFGVAAALSAAAILCVLVVPLLLLHSYPSLETTGMKAGVMILQRCVLLLFAVLTSFNIVMIVRTYLKAGYAVAIPIGLAWHVVTGYLITWLSFTTEGLRRLNDVFYYNQLWRYFDSFPQLQRPEVYHNIEAAYFGFLAAAAGIYLATFLLWLPGAAYSASRTAEHARTATPPRPR